MRIVILASLFAGFTVACDDDAVRNAGDDSDPTPGENPECTPAATAVETHGQLQVDQYQMVNACGDAVRLKGVSTQWLNWEHNYGESRGAMKWMVDNWGITVYRAAMGVDANGAYLSNPDGSEEQVRTIVENAIELGIYVLIDWHSHNAHLGSQPDEAVAFFTRMAEDYGEYPNVFYEIYNEPEAVTWADIKPYHERVVAAIRAVDPDNIIIMGTPYWSQNVDEAAQDPVDGTNLMYTVHFYSCDHTTTDLLGRAWRGYAKGLAVFVTEWGATELDGGRVNPGRICEDEADRWFDQLEEMGASFIAWKLDACNEASCLFRAGAPVDGPFTDYLQGHGPYVVSKLLEE